MSEELLMKSVMSVIISGILAYDCWVREKRETDPELKDENRPRYATTIPVLMLPCIILMIFVISMTRLGLRECVEVIMALCFEIFLQISIFYMMLLLLLPLLRRYFSAKACAILWILPTFLYYVTYSTMNNAEPLLVITIPNKVVNIITIIWSAGFLLVFSYYIVSHFHFRKYILSNTTFMTDEKARIIWAEEKRYANIQNNLDIVISPNVKTPLSIGLLRGTTKVVLPEREYTEEELRLIFRHELVHIGREDSCTKLFILFCTAICWFNPLMWIAMRKSADDLELSCDETVLADSDDITRKQYAKLILETEGDHRGFTTCLSASVTALRYRLSNIVKKRKRKNGGVVVGIILFILMMTSGYIALAYDVGIGENVIFYAGSVDEHKLYSMRLDNESGSNFVTCTDEDALKEYLSKLKMARLTSDYTFSNDKERIICVFQGPNEELGVSLTEHHLTVSKFQQNNLEVETYYVTSEVDWDYILELLE